MPRTKRNGPKTLPPDVEAATAVADYDEGAPTLTVEEIANLQATTETNMPVLTPPTEALAAAEDEMAVTAWLNGVKVTALWSNASPRNAYASIEGLGWRRITPANDSAFLSISAMLSHARQMNATCNVRVETDGLIHEVYVW